MNLSDRQSQELRNAMTWNSFTSASVCLRNKTFSIDGFWFSGTVGETRCAREVTNMDKNFLQNFSTGKQPAAERLLAGASRSL